ncbi:SanA protein, partial [Cronobacter sakazakii]|nr:SanA protein [Cronobacter sakazakii]EMC4233988.1 SanA protein [Cronobacter sakazakii]EMC4347019.1 SanA protein [Cronobacter sakazakii]
MKFSSRSKRGLTLAAVIILTGALLLAMAIIGADRAVTHAAAGRLYDTVDNIPARKVG